MFNADQAWVDKHSGDWNRTPPPPIGYWPNSVFGIFLTDYRIVQPGSVVQRGSWLIEGEDGTKFIISNEEYEARFQEVGYQE